MLTSISSQVDAYARAVAPQRTDRPSNQSSAGRVDSNDRQDAVELSSPPQPARAVRHELVQRVRAEIAAEAYLTPEKLDIALRRLRDSISAESV